MFKIKKFFSSAVLILAFAITLTACKEDSNGLPNYPAGTSEKSTTKSSNSLLESDAEESNTNDSESTTGGLESTTPSDTQSSPTDNETSDSKSSEDSVSVPETAIPTTIPLLTRTLFQSKLPMARSNMH